MGETKETSYTLTLETLTDATQVNASGGTNTQSLQPDAGYIYEVISIFYGADDPAGSTSGTHKLEINHQNMNTPTYAIITATTGNNIRINDAGFTGDSLERPGNVDDQYKVMRNWLIATNGQPIDFVYTNSTDANQTGTRTLQVMCKKFREAL